MSTQDRLAALEAALAAEQARAAAAESELAKRKAGRTEPRKENYTFVDASRVRASGDGLMLVGLDLASLVYKPSTSGKVLVSTIGIGLPGGLSAQMVIRAPLGWKPGHAHAPGLGSGTGSPRLVKAADTDDGDE